MFRAGRQRRGLWYIQQQAANLWLLRDHQQLVRWQRRGKERLPRSDFLLKRQERLTLARLVVMPRSEKKFSQNLNPFPASTSIMKIFVSQNGNSTWHRTPIKVPLNETKIKKSTKLGLRINNYSCKTQKQILDSMKNLLEFLKVNDQLTPRQKVH